MPGLFGRKIGMTQIFDEEGNAVPVTLIQLLENTVTAKLLPEKNGYAAIQVGCEVVTPQKLSKPERNHLSKNNLPIFRQLKEFRVSVDLLEKYQIGSKLEVSDILGGEETLVDITGKPKGKGTQGRIKRWNQSRRRMSHGTKHHRQIGSAGAGTTPGRVFPGLHMPGRDSNLVTIRKLRVIKILAEKNLILIKGGVPTHKQGLLVIQPSVTSGWNQRALSLGKRRAT